ncbi:MAG: phosphoadenosine phosphosulfate reductase family protein [Nocardioides sp.]
MQTRHPEFVIEREDLALDGRQVARLTRTQREDRVGRLVEHSLALLDHAIEESIVAEGKRLAATAVLFSGGNDSTVLAHLFREVATHAVHAKTGIGIEQTRQFVRDVCGAWGLPLVERHPPTGSTYRDLVLDQSFPGPGHHFKMYQRLKERCLRQARNELVPSPRTHRVVFLAGRRRNESARRANVPAVERDGSVVWVSPLVFWTAPDMVTYRLLAGDVPHNEVSALIHMSGECLCGSFARAGELEEIGFWFPGVRAEIEALEAEVRATGKVPPWKARWGWGSDKETIAKLRKSGYAVERIAALLARSASGPLCSSCDAGEQTEVARTL